jgi:hypothetical protein
LNSRRHGLRPPALLHDMAAISLYSCSAACISREVSSRAQRPGSPASSGSLGWGSGAEGPLCHAERPGEPAFGPPREAKNSQPDGCQRKAGGFSVENLQASGSGSCLKRPSNLAEYLFIRSGVWLAGVAEPNGVEGPLSPHRPLCRQPCECCSNRLEQAME